MDSDAKDRGVSALDLVEELGLQCVHCPKKLSDYMVNSTEINRLALNLLDSFYTYDPKKCLLVGITELNFLKKTVISVQKDLLGHIYESPPPIIILTSNVDVGFDYIDIFKVCDVPIVRTREHTDKFVASFFSYMTSRFAKKHTIHGVLMEIYSTGVLITGKSGIGKSESAVELIRRGHRFVSDDAVQVKILEDKHLVGEPPKNIRNFLEIRGIGIINIKSMFGMSSIKKTQKIHMEVHLQDLNFFSGKNRLFINAEYSEFFGIKIPKINIPVYPGRSVSTIIETAVMNTKNRAEGYDSTLSLMNNLKGF